MSYKSPSEPTSATESYISHPALSGRRSLSPKSSNAPSIRRTGTMPTSASYRVTPQPAQTLTASKSAINTTGRQHSQNPVTSSSVRSGHPRKGIPTDLRQQQTQLLQPPSRDRYQPGSPPGGTNTQASQFFTKVKDKFVEKVFQTTSEGPQLAAVVQERRQRAAVEYEAKLLADCVGRWKECITKGEEVKRPASLFRQPHRPLSVGRFPTPEVQETNAEQPLPAMSSRGKGAWARALTKLNEDKLRGIGAEENQSEESDAVTAMPQSGAMKGKWGTVISRLNRERRESLTETKVSVMKTVSESRSMSDSTPESNKGSRESLGSSQQKAPRDRKETIQAARLAFRRRSISEDNCLPLFPPPSTLQQKPRGFGDTSPQGNSQELGGIVCSSDDFQAIIKLSQKASVRKSKKSKPVSSAECIPKQEHLSSSDINHSGASLDERGGGRGSSGGSSLSVTIPHSSSFLANPISHTPRTSAGQISLTVSEVDERSGSRRSSSDGRRSSSDGRTRRSPEADLIPTYASTALRLSPCGTGVVTTIIPEPSRSTGRVSPATVSQRSVLINTSPGRGSGDSTSKGMTLGEENKEKSSRRSSSIKNEVIEDEICNVDMAVEICQEVDKAIKTVRTASEDDSLNPADAPPEIIFDEHGQTWDIYGAEFDPEILGDAIQIHLEKLMRGKGILTSSRLSLSDGEEESEDDEEKGSKIPLTEGAIRRKETRSLSSRYSDEVPRKKQSTGVDQSQSTDNFLVRFFCAFHRRNS